MEIRVGDKAPGFILPDQGGKSRKLSDYKGFWVLLYFYPRDFTPGCTKEACGIRDNFADFEKAGVKVLGVSKDSVEFNRPEGQNRQNLLNGQTGRARQTSFARFVRI